MTGILLLDKPQGLSSHAAVHRVRKITGQARAGHAGTLDPMATGVLLILLGSTVRLSEYIVEHDKRYHATVQLGVETDTYDAKGSVTATKPVNLTPTEIERALYSFVGKSEQVPPAHSAIQVQGKRAYKLARQGISLELAPRAVEIFFITNIVVEDAIVAFDVHCRKGTYIRSLAHDLGERLGTGAHLAALRRTAVGQFSIERALTLEQVTDAAASGTLEPHLLPPDLAVTHLDAVHLDAQTARAVRNGQFISCSQDLTTPVVRAYDEKGVLIAILERTSDQKLKPKKVLEN